jgi:hypothetical protein
VAFGLCVRHPERMDYFVVYRPGSPETWHITSTAGFYDVATTPVEALMMIGADVNRNDPDAAGAEFSVRWINTPVGFRSPEPDDVPELEEQEAEPIQ